MNLFTCLLLAQSLQPVAPAAGPKPVGPYSPGLWANGRLYVSGQGARNPAGVLPSGPEDQIRSTLDNLKAVVEAGGLTLDHVVFAHVFYADLKHYALLNRIWTEYFKAIPPARATVQVAAMPTSTPFEINAIAVRDRTQIAPIALPGSKSPVPLSPAIQTKDHIYVSGILGRDSDSGVIPATLAAQCDLAFDRLGRVLGAARITPRHIISLNVYLAPGMTDEAFAAALARHLPDQRDLALSISRVPALPFGANIGLHGVALRNPAPRLRHGACVSALGTVHCGQITADDYRTALIGLNGLLEKFPGAPPRIAASQVFLDDLGEFAAMNRVYAEVMAAPFPTRTTVQPMPVGQSAKFRITVTAESVR
jgi:2-iminobutanoate/2-iminopropanoate deaminase